MEILEIANDKEIIYNTRIFIQKLINYFGETDILLYAIQDGDSFGFIGRKKNECLYLGIKDGELVRYEFRVNEDKVVSLNTPEGIYAYIEDELCFYKNNGEIEALYFEKSDFLDEDDYDGAVIYKQRHPSERKKCEIHYQQNYRSNGSNPPLIYSYHCEHPKYVYLNDEGTAMEADYYRIDFPIESKGARILSFMVGNDVESITRGEVSIYAKLFSLSSKRHCIWPLGKFIKPSEMANLISENGFNIHISERLLNINNMHDNIFCKLSEMARLMHEVNLAKNEDKIAVVRLRF